MADEIFDPEIHAVDKDGNPSVNRDGSFRKKRRDAGRKGAAPSAKAPSSGGGSARAQYRKQVDQFLQVGVTVASFADPVIGYAAGTLAPMWSEALADLAVDNPRMAAALERVGTFGAASNLLGVGLITFVTIGHLVGKVPAHLARTMGAPTRDEIEQILTQRGVELAAKAKAADRAEAEANAAVGEHFDQVSGEPGRYTEAAANVAV